MALPSFFPVLVAFSVFSVAAVTFAVPIIQVVDITGGQPNIIDGGNVIDLRLDQYSASGFQSKDQFLFARVDMQIKLPAGDSAGTVTTFYMSSLGDAHDEIDIEFLGNVSGQPLVLHTNIYSQGKGNREMQFYLWFDPTAAFHTYSVLWNTQFIIIYVDGQPIRAFPNMSSIGIPFPTYQQMRVYASIWNADQWATQGGRVKTDWSHAPFVASYTNLATRSCPASSTDPLCTIQSPPPPPGSQVPQLDSWTRNTIQGIEAKYMIYNYCTDTQRFPQGLPPECSIQF